ncbi:hypothetical protein BDF14DRAFT_1744394 [Spinellus fusiger]|nr:hypothetical protein BDF14DRAFT_1744394 [Spinellus fusiger]
MAHSQPHYPQDAFTKNITKRVDPLYSKTLHEKAKKLLSIQHDSFPGTQPVLFESRHLSLLEQEDYFVSERTQGIRYLLFIVHSPKGPASFMVSWRFLVFDLMAVNALSITQRSFNRRLGILQQEVLIPFNASLCHLEDPRKQPPFTLELKKMERAYGLSLVFDKISKLKSPHEGVVWIPVNCPYVSGLCERLLKWRPPEFTTATFRISARWNNKHKPIYAIEVVSHGANYRFFDHLQLEPSFMDVWKDNLPDGRIAEFRFVRFRDDKCIADDEISVNKTIDIIRDGVSHEQLLAHMKRPTHDDDSDPLHTPSTVHDTEDSLHSSDHHGTTDEIEPTVTDHHEENYTNIKHPKKRAPSQQEDEAPSAKMAKINSTDTVLDTPLYQKSSSAKDEEQETLHKGDHTDTQTEMPMCEPVLSMHKNMSSLTLMKISMNIAKTEKRYHPSLRHQ